MLEIIFDAGFPPSILKECRDSLNSCKSLFPSWMNTLHVHYIAFPDEEERSALAIVVQQEYRIADMYVYPAYLSINEERKEASITHEVAHCHLNSVYQFCSMLLNTLLDNTNPAKATLDECLRMCNESSTEDLTRTFLNILRSNSEEKTSKGRRTAKALQ